MQKIILSTSGCTCYKYHLRAHRNIGAARNRSISLSKNVLCGSFVRCGVRKKTYLEYTMPIKKQGTINAIVWGRQKKHCPC